MRPAIHIRYLYLMPALLFIALASAADVRDDDSLTAAWHDYTSSLHTSGLQAGCRPRHYRPSPDTAARGAVLLIHGFGACPQQYFQLGPAIAAAGFEVLVPLLPGHGHLPDSNGKDDLSALPAGRNWGPYGDFAAQMNSIMALAPGEHVIVGYSLGGGVALHAILQNPQLYDRALLLAPLLAIRGGHAIEHIAEFLGEVPLLKDIRVKTPGLRRECKNWAEAGRAGFCDYQYKHAAALVHLEEQNREWLTQTQPTLPLQLILARGDHTISNRAIREFSEKQMKHGPIGLCYLPEDVPHEVLTPYENIGRRMYWLQELLDIMLEFVTGGKLKGKLVNADDPVAHCLRPQGQRTQRSEERPSFTNVASVRGRK